MADLVLSSVICHEKLYNIEELLNFFLNGEYSSQGFGKCCV